MFLYLAVTDIAISVVLVKKERGIEKSIYYTTKVLHRAEIRYKKIDILPVP